MAGAAAASVPLLDGVTPLKLVGAVVLADALWGALWRWMPGAVGQQGRGKGVKASSLPYFQARSPLDQMARFMREISGGLTWREIGAAGGVSLLLSVLGRSCSS